MRRLARLAGLAPAALLALAPAALAAHPDRFWELSTNLDGDAALERVRAEEGSSVDHRESYARVLIVDRCRTYLVVRSTVRIVTAEPVQADGRGRREVLALAVGRHDEGQAALVRLHGRAGTCPRLRALFRYDAAKPPLPPPPGFAIAAVTVAVADLDRRHPGSELRLVEQYTLGPMLSSLRRETRYRYVRPRDRYERYATSVTRVP